jgi:hypothetical protein
MVVADLRALLRKSNELRHEPSRELKQDYVRALLHLLKRGTLALCGLGEAQRVFHSPSVSSCFFRYSSLLFSNALARATSLLRFDVSSGVFGQEGNSLPPGVDLREAKATMKSAAPSSVEAATEAWSVSLAAGTGSASLLALGPEVVRRHRIAHDVRAPVSGARPAGIRAVRQITSASIRPCQTASGTSAAPTCSGE